MDILYVVGKDSGWDNNELRYSLRSIAKYGQNVGRVYIVGYKPDFVSDEVIYIPCNDPYYYAHKNILHKVLYAINNSDISDHFLISSDDHFYIKPTDFDDYPVYSRSDEIMSISSDERKNQSYFLSLVETRELLQKHGMTTYQTNPHCNTHFDVNVYKKNKRLFDECFKLPHGGELNCIMGNLLIKQGAKHETFLDSKIGIRFTADDIKKRIKETNCISGIPEICSTPLPGLLSIWFRKKCKYEK